MILPPCAAVQLGLYEVNPSGGASVRYVQLLEDDIAPTALELEDAVPLSALLAPVGEAKESIVAALESLQAEPFDAPLKGEVHEHAALTDLHGQNHSVKVLQLPDAQLAVSARAQRAIGCVTAQASRSSCRAGVPLAAPCRRCCATCLARRRCSTRPAAGQRQRAPIHRLPMAQQRLWPAAMQVCKCTPVSTD